MSEIVVIVPRLAMDARMYPAYNTQQLKDRLTSADPETRRKMEAEIAAREAGTSVARVTPQVAWGAKDADQKRDADGKFGSGGGSSSQEINRKSLGGKLEAANEAFGGTKASPETLKAIGDALQDKALSNFALADKFRIPVGLASEMVKARSTWVKNDLGGSGKAMTQADRAERYLKDNRNR